MITCIDEYFITTQELFYNHTRVISISWPLQVAMMFPRLYAVLRWDRATQIIFPLHSFSENNNNKKPNKQGKRGHLIYLSSLCATYISIRCSVALFCTWGGVEKGHYQQTGSAFCTCLHHFHTTISVTVSLSVHSLHSCWCIYPSLLHSSKHRCVRWCCPRTLSWGKVCGWVGVSDFWYLGDGEEVGDSSRLNLHPFLDLQIPVVMND